MVEPRTEAGRTLLSEMMPNGPDFSATERAGYRECAEAILAIEGEARDASQPAQASFTVEVTQELARARSKFAQINSLHEGYAVIAEELDEFWEEVRGKDPERLNRAYRELVQVAAMAQRTAEDVIAKDRPDASFDALYRGVRLIDVEQLAKALISSDLLARYSEYATKAGVRKEPVELLANAWAHHIAVAYYGQETTLDSLDASV